MIKLVNVSKFYNSKGVINMALKDINLTFNKGEIVAIVGESGSGKSTLLNIICGIDNYDEGEIYFNDQETSYFNQEDMDNFRQKNVSFIYQNYNVIDSYTVLENVMVPLLLKGMKEKEAKKRAKDLIDRVGLTDRIKSKAVNLSGGEKQRTVIARALATDCPILACDEITGNLDSKTGDEIIQLIKEVSKDKLVLMVTHNLEQCESIITRKIKLSDGTIVEDTNLSIDDETTDEELLDNEKKAPAHALATITKWNVKNTPKKTIFSTIVMYAISFVVIFLLSLGSFIDIYVNFGDYNPYSQSFNDRVIVYNKDHSPLNKDDFSMYDQKNIVYNTMIEEYAITVDQLNAWRTYGYPTSHVDKDLNIFKGRAPQKSGEFLLCSPNKNDSIFDDYKIDEKVDFLVDEYSPNPIKMKSNLVGFAYSPKLKGYLFVMDEGSFFHLQNEICKSHFSGTSAAWEAKISYNLQVKSVDKKAEKGIDKPVVHYTGSDNIAVDYIDIPYFEMYNIHITDFDLVNDAPDPTALSYVEYVSLPGDFVPEEVFEISVYTDSVNKFVNEMKNKGYDTILPSKSISKSQLNTTMSKYFIGISIISGFVLNLVAYVVISRIYDYKIKEFAVFRSLGYLKSSMSKIVHLEMTLIGAVSLVLGLITIPLIGLRVPFFGQLTTCMNIWWILLSIAIVLLLSNFLAWRLNRRIFKQTLVKTFKSEEAK